MNHPVFPLQNDRAGRVVVFFILCLFSVGLVAGIYVQLLSPVPGTAEPMVPYRQIEEATIVCLAAGIGSLIYAIRAYLLHACERRDFDMRYVPWYIFWVLLGSLVGLVVYFALRGGVLLLTIGNDSEPLNFNTWSLGAAGALSGLFSKYAIEKLRKVFLTLFTASDGDNEAAEEAEANLKPTPQPVG